MLIDTQSEEMFWILCRVNMDLMDFLCDEKPEHVLQVKRGDWIKCWQEENLNPVTLEQWLPTNDN